MAREGLEAVPGALTDSIRLWPRPAPDDPLASRLGGLPALPEDFDWPRTDEEAMLFLAQIDRAALQTAVGANPLPASGLLLFFGDEHETSGCGPEGGGAVYYIEDTRKLRRAPPPVEEFHLLPECGLDFFLSCEFPHPKSRAFADLDLPEPVRPAYVQLHAEPRLASARILPDQARLDNGSAPGLAPVSRSSKRPHTPRRRARPNPESKPPCAPKPNPWLQTSSSP